MKEDFLKQIAASRDMALTAALHNRFVRVAKALLDRGIVQFGAAVTMVRDDITEHLLMAAEKFASTECFDNFELLRPLFRQMAWLGDESVLIYEITCQRVAHVQGKAGVELKLKEYLELAKCKQWRRAVRAAARALGFINKG